VDWLLSYRADPEARVLADRHYSRQNPDSPQFVPPGRCLVLKIPGAAFWVTSYPFARYVKHEWAGAMTCSAFRNERPDLYRSSDLIRQALACTRWNWPDLPALGMITFVDQGKVRRKRDPGRCFIRAGFENVGKSKGGLIALQILPDGFPAPAPPIGGALRFGLV